MGVLERRVRHREVLRQQILDAAREVFVKEGYENVSMRKIAEKIEYSPTTIYLYFRDKNELLTCLTEETFSRLVEIIQKITQEEPSPGKQLDCCLRAYIDFGLTNPDHYKVAFLIRSEQNFMAEGTMARHGYNVMREILAECIRTHVVRTVDLDVGIQTLWAGIHGLTSLLILHPQFPWADRRKLIESVIETIAGLRAE